jgi:hypothetical protein
MSDLRVRFPRPCDEEWERMAPSGCDRVCARCDTLIHDLSRYTFDEAEALLRRGGETCVRARVDADGVVALKPGRTMRRMMIAGAAAGLLATSVPAVAGQEKPSGVIAGTVNSYGMRTRITATGPDGKTFRTRASDKGTYRIKHVPAGTYTLTFEPDCGESWKVENVIVGAEEVVVPESAGEDQCIVVGMLEIDTNAG